MELAFLNYKLEEENINLVIHHNKITGIMNDVDSTIFNLVNLKKIGKGQIIINGEKVSKDDIFMSQKRISVIYDDNNFPPYLKTVEDLMNNYLRINYLNAKNPLKKIKDSLKIVGLNDDTLYRDIISLSSSEKKLISIAMGLLSNPDTIVLEEPFKYLDLKQEKRLFMILQKFKEQYDKTIIIKSESSDLLFKYTEECVIIRDNQILIDGNTKEIFQRVDYLKRNGIDIPEIVKFTYLVKKNKNVKIDYHRDIRDIIKDIYKHV